MSWMGQPSGMTFDVDVKPREDHLVQEPKDVHDWLRDRGWQMAGEIPSSFEQLYCNANADPENLLYTWSEAVAYEMFRFMNIGS